MRLLAEAGYPGGNGMPPFQVTTWPEFRQEFAYYASQWSNVGIPVTLNVVPKTKFYESSNRGEYVAYYMGWTAAYPDAMNFLGELFGGDSPFNQIGWRNADFDRLIGQANATTDPTTRATLYRTAERLVLDDFPVLPLVVPDYVALRCSPIADRSPSTTATTSSSGATRRSATSCAPRRRLACAKSRGRLPGGASDQKNGVYLDFAEAIGRLGVDVIEERYGNLIQMSEHSRR